MDVFGIGIRDAKDAPLLRQIKNTGCRNSRTILREIKRIEGN